MRVRFNNQQTEPFVALRVAGRSFDALVDTGFGGLLLGYAYPPHLYDTTTFFNNTVFAAPVRRLPLRHGWSLRMHNLLKHGCPVCPSPSDH